MIKLAAFSLVFLFPLTIIGQQLELLTDLNSSMNESSGLIYLEGRLITHNDSGGEPKLYELDSHTGNIVREVEVLNAVNKDWEDICYDDDYIYIGDFGNNTGSRTDLKIYRIPRQDYLDNNNSTVSAEVISFNYSDQIDFTIANLNTEYDAESIISLGDSLYIFTKNWVSNRTFVYPIPKTPDHYELIKIDSLDIGGLATGADICPETGRIILTAYTLFQPYIVILSDYSENLFSQGTVETINLQAPSGYSYQIEAVAVISENLFYITSEKNSTGNSGLYKLGFNTNGISEEQSEAISIYPNPTSDYFYVSTSQNTLVNIYNIIGEKVKSSTSKKIDIRELSAGIYAVEICESNSQVFSTQKLIIRP
ncbi:MAG TPA: T9SS type A sorting domain-containing protein [Brumimicrobium sp.]|nr:T9SS type A sorting domain-containing protein [Brumimicrobium sp.]